MTPNKKDLKQIKILLVESDVEQANVFLQLTKLNNWFIHVCQESMEAIQWIKSNGAPDLIVIEKNALPLDGFQIQSYLNSELKMSVPIIISDESVSINEEKHHTSIQFITKPFSKKSITIINTQIKKHKNSKQTNSKDYSLDYLRNLSDNDEEFVLKSLNIFRDSIPIKLIELKDALLINEYETIRNIAHNIKPSFEMLGSYEGKDICNTLVYITDENQVPALINQLRQIFNTIDIQLKNDITNFAQV